jgi:hypothetical protein
MDLKNQLKTLSHHAYAIIGGDEIVAELMIVLEKHHSIKLHGNQDLFNRKYINMTIDDAREVKAAHLMRPVVEGGRKIFIMQMDNISVEAQNALLKLLEEPAEYAHFFIIIPSSHLLISTVKSRMQIIVSGNSDDPKSVKDKELMSEAMKFIKASPTRRLEMIKMLMDAIGKEKRNKQDAIDFLDAIQAVVYEERGAEKGMSQLGSIEVARKYMNDRSPSLKMLLEYTALNL